MSQQILKFSDRKGYKSLDSLLEILVSNRIRIVSCVVTEYLEEEGAKINSLVDLLIKKATIIVDKPDDMKAHLMLIEIIKKL